MAQTFDATAFKTKIEATSDKLTIIIKQAHKFKVSDDEITEAVEFLSKDMERKPAGECLQKAACFGYIKLANLLLDKGVNINTRDMEKNTPLINACHTRHYDIAKMLVERGAFINAKNKYKWSALKYTCLSNNIEFAKYLLEKGADTDIITKDGKQNVIAKIISKDDGRYTDMLKYLRTVRESLQNK